MTIFKYIYSFKLNESILFTHRIKVENRCECCPLLPFFFSSFISVPH